MRTQSELLMGFNARYIREKLKQLYKALQLMDGSLFSGQVYKKCCETISGF